MGIDRRAAPSLTGDLRPAERAALRLAAVALVLVIAGAAAHTLLGAGGPGLDELFRDSASSAVYVLVALSVALRAARVPDSRGAWTLLAVGISLYCAGNLLWSLWLESLPDPPIPSVADVLWLSLYPLTYAGLVVLGRPRGKRVPAGVWLDGLIGGLGIAAIGSALVFDDVMASAVGSPTAVATNLAYPIADLLLSALVVGLLALRGWRLDRLWALVGGGLLLLTAADGLYLMSVAQGMTDSSAFANLFYMAAVALLARAAWVPMSPPAQVRVDTWSMLLVPAGFTAMSVALLISDHFVRLGTAAFVLAQLTVVIAVVRTGLTFREVRALAASRHEAATDDLTGLPNRRHFLRRLADEVEAARAAGSSLALLVMDLDHFKELNDTLGHHAGDQLLEQVGPRLLSAVRTGDTVARLGGDEFGVLLGAPSDEAAALRVSDAILRAIDQPFTVRDLQLSAAASIGVALFPHHGSHPEELLQRADIAMYQAKASRGGRELYARHRDNHSLDRLTLMADLRTALANGGLELHYQAQAGAHDGIVVGFEALVRWPHPARGLLRPAAFVPLAEQAGLSRRMTGWILDEALRRCAAWRREGRDLHVAVNATVADLLDLDFPGEVAGALRRHRLEPRSLVIEVTEGSFLSDPVRIDGVLTRLRDLGVGLSLDDFGTGFSSLTHLRTLPVHEVKIDRSFVAPMQSDEADAAIVGSTIALAHALGMRVIAEGVEDEATWRALAALGCDLVQGFELAPPLPADQLAPLLDVSHLAWHGDAVPMEPSAA